MLKSIYRITFLAAAVAAFGCFAGVNAQSVSGSIGNGTVALGKATKATVVLSLPAGLHVNSSRPGSEYAIPTKVSATATGVKIGAVTYPKGTNRKFEFSENTLNVYEGRTAFGFNVTVPATYKGTTVKVYVNVKYQACTNEVCYAPKNKQVTLTAKVK
ncbi:hypothetical protein BH10ACI3_BH10ACI3_08400 [soil metagenome]